VDNKSPRGYPEIDSNKKSRRNGRRLARCIPVRQHLLNALTAIAVLVVGAIIVAGSYIAALIPTTPSIEDLLDAQIAEPSVLYSADGKQLAVFSQGHQERVSLSQVSPNIIKALIATEDHRFHEHSGVDLKRTLYAVFHTFRGDAQGGSTITQQLARNMFPEEIGRSRTIERKLKEIITALKIEQTYTKDQILETYLNTVPFLYNVHGIEMAARTYFDKSAAELGVIESATLIGMLKGTSYYNPVQNPERAQKRRNVVLAQMAKRGLLSEQEFRSLREEPLQVRLNRQPDPLGTAPHFAAHLRRWLIEWADKNNYNLYTEGLVIHSTIDDRLQQTASEAVARQAQVLQTIADVEWGRSTTRVASHSPGAYTPLRKGVEPFRHFWSEYPGLLDTFIRETPEYRKAVASGQSAPAVLAKLKADGDFGARLRAAKTRLEAGFVAMDPVTGEVKAWVGSRDFERDQFDHVAQAMRQPGSTFKPIVYGAALEIGMAPDRAYKDGPVEIVSVDGSIWRPTDMSGFSGKAISLRDGLVLSKNTITAQVMQDVGLPTIINLAQAVGINQSRLDPVPSLALGTSPVTLLEMVNAYSTIARIGEYRPPLMVKRIADRNGKVLAEFGTQGTRALSEYAAVELIDMMRGAVRRGTGQAVTNQFGIVADIAGKTGTTQNNTDGWFILMHPNLVAGAWVGFNDQRVRMRSDHWGQGGHNAILLVGDFFKDTLKSKMIDAKAQFPKPNRPPPLIVSAPPQDWLQQLESNGGLPDGYGVITRDDGGGTVFGPDRTATVPLDDLGRFVMGMDRESETGGPSSSGESGPGDEEPEPPSARPPTYINVW
jgi:penicillin-binding protein 1A